MHTTSSIIPCACGIEEATDTNAQTILSQHEIRIRLRVGVSVRDRTMVRFSVSTGNGEYREGYKFKE